MPEPEKRASAKKMLQHSWLATKLPQENYKMYKYFQT